MMSWGEKGGVEMGTGGWGVGGREENIQEKPNKSGFLPALPWAS